MKQFDLNIDNQNRESVVQKNCTAWDTLIAEKFHHGRFDSIYKWLSPEYKWHGPSGWISKASDDFIDLIKEARRGVPDIKFSNQFIGSGNMVANLWSVTGTHQGEYVGVAASGNHIDYAGIALGRFEEGRLIEEWELWNNIDLAKSLGVINNHCEYDSIIDALRKKSEDSLVKYSPFNYTHAHPGISLNNLLYPANAAVGENPSQQVLLNVASWKRYIKKHLGDDIFRNDQHDNQQADQGDSGKGTVYDHCSGAIAGWPLSLFQTMFGDLNCTARMFGEGDYIACHMLWQGTHTGSIDGIPATGEPVCFTTISIAKFSSTSELEQHWDVMEEITLLQQLGVVTEDKSQNLIYVFS
ncbi:ester cyclase [SAR92 clade bacterium H246]